MPVYSPSDLWAKVEADGEAVNDTDRVNRRDYKRWRESWCAARFGLGYERQYGADVCQIDISDQDEGDDYDFHFLVRNLAEGKNQQRRLPFQVAEVMDGHARDAEYRRLSREERLAAEAARGGTPEYGLERLGQVLQGKIDRRYGRPKQLHLLLYLNVNAGRLRWHRIVSATQRQAAVFASLWVVTPTDFCLAYCDGEYRRWLRLNEWKSINGVAPPVEPAS